MSVGKNVKVEKHTNNKERKNNNNKEKKKKKKKKKKKTRSAKPIRARGDCEGRLYLIAFLLLSGFVEGTLEHIA